MKEVYILITRYHPDITASGNLVKNLIPFFEEQYTTYILSEGATREGDREQNIYRFPTDNKDDFITKVKNRLGKKTLSFNSKMYFFLEEKIKQLPPWEKISLIPITIEEITLAVNLKKKFPDKVILTPYLLEELLVYYKASSRNKLKEDLEAVADTLFILPKLKGYFTSDEKVIILEHPMVKNEISLEPKRQNRILYAGGLNQRTRNPQAIIEAFQKMRGIDFQLVFYSYGNCERMLKRFSEKDSRIVAHGAIDATSVMQEMAHASILITIGNKNTNLVPSKIFDCISTGNPILHFYYDEKDPYIGYLKDYDLSLCLPIQDIDTEKLKNFIQSVSHKQVSFEKIKEKYHFALPEVIFQQMNEQLEVLHR